MDGWSAYYNEGASYYNTTIGGLKKSRPFGNTVYYNLIGLALEAFLTAATVKEDFLPEHSSISGMIRELRKKYEVPEHFTGESRFFNRFMNMCSLEVTPEIIPTDEELQRLVVFLKDVRMWTESLLGVSCATT